MMPRGDPNETNHPFLRVESHNSNEGLFPKITIGLLAYGEIQAKPF
jgi:hypothetical protein